VLKDHEIDDELRNVNSNAFQEAIDQEGREPHAWLYFPNFGRRL